MDAILDATPDDHGEEIKKRVRDRDGSDDEGPVTKRPRADTDPLLPPEYFKQEAKDPSKSEGDVEDPPEPEEDLENIPKSAFRQVLCISYGRKKRGTLLLAPKCTWLSKRWDEVYCSYTFYFKAQSPEEQERNQEYLRLRKIEFKANYGDYLGQELQEFRASLKEKKKPLVYNDPVHRAARNLGAGRGGVKTWSEIAEELTEELNQTNWSRMRRDVDIACDFLNLDPQHMVWLIKEWGDRNRKVHNRIREHIENCQWNLLADQLCRDLKELANVEVDKDELAKYEEVMVHIRERYFIVYNRDDPRFWFANDRAKKKSKDLATKLKENP